METSNIIKNRLYRRFRLSSHQLKVLNDIENNDAEIIVDHLDGEISYRVSSDIGEYQIRYSTFDRLKSLGLIRFRGLTTVDQERWW